MPLSDVKVIIDIKKPSSMNGLGTPLILANKPGKQTYKEYKRLDLVEVDFTKETDAYKFAEKIFEQGDNRPDKVAIATYDGSGSEPTEPVGTLDKYFYNDWYFVMLDTGVVADYEVVSDFVESKSLKMAVHAVDKKEDYQALKAKKYDRTIVFFHNELKELPHAALIGAVGSKTVGSVTWKFKNLKGVTTNELGPSDLIDIHDNGAIAYVTKAGIPQTSEGTVVSGEYIDVIHGKDWVKITMEHEVQKLFALNDKISFVDSGIAQIESVVKTVLEIAGRNGIIAQDDSGGYLYKIKALGRNEVSDADRVVRKYNGLSFSFDLAGAIHEATIQGEIVI